MASKRTISVALVIPTKDKLQHLERTLPAISKLGFDEVLVLDSSMKEKEGVRDLCKKCGVRYEFAIVDRQGGRNTGARMVLSDWVCIADDDVLFKKFDLDRFAELAQGHDYLFGGWGVNPGAHYAWMFRRDFFLDTLKGYDPMITGGDDLDITLRAEKAGKGIGVFDKGVYESESIGLDIATEYPGKWIRNRALYALTSFPLIWRHKFLVKSVIAGDVWRLRRVSKGESLGRAVLESLIDRSGTIYSPLYYIIQRRKQKA
jgi:glycosyltransferase involved in cell wall biosynthesis